MGHSGELVIILIESVFIIPLKPISKSHMSEGWNRQGWCAWDRVRVEAGDAIGRIPAEMRLPACVPQTTPGGSPPFLPGPSLGLPPKALWLVQMVLVGVGSTTILGRFWVGGLWPKAYGAPSPSSPCMKQKMLLAAGCRQGWGRAFLRRPTGNGPRCTSTLAFLKWARVAS